MLPEKKRSDLVLIDGKEFCNFLSQEANEANKNGRDRSNNDMTQMQARGERQAYKKILKFFNKLKSDI